MCLKQDVKHVFFFFFLSYCTYLVVFSWQTWLREKGSRVHEWRWVALRCLCSFWWMGMNGICHIVQCHSQQESKQIAHPSHIHQAIFHNLFKTNDQSRPSAANLCLLSPLTCGSNNYQQTENVCLCKIFASFSLFLNCKVHPVLEEVGDLTASHRRRLSLCCLLQAWVCFGGWVVVFWRNYVSVYTAPSSSLQLDHNRHLSMIMWYKHSVYTHYWDCVCLCVWETSRCRTGWRAGYSVHVECP